MLNWIGGKLGYATPPPAAAPPATDLRQRQLTAEDCARLMRTKQVQIAQLREEHDDVEREKLNYVAQGKRNDAKGCLEKQAQLREEIATLQGQLESLREQQATLARAEANVEQARLLQQGSKQLETQVKQAEDIDLDGAVDSFREGARQTQSYSERLAKPLRPRRHAADEEQVDAELDALMATAAAVGRPTELPEAPTAPQGRSETAAPTAAVATRQRRAQPQGLDK